MAKTHTSNNAPAAAHSLRGGAGAGYHKTPRADEEHSRQDLEDAYLEGYRAGARQWGWGGADRFTEGNAQSSVEEWLARRYPALAAPEPAPWWGRGLTIQEAWDAWVGKPLSAYENTRGGSTFQVRGLHHTVEVRFLAQGARPQLHGRLHTPDGTRSFVERYVRNPAQALQEALSLLIVADLWTRVRDAHPGQDNMPYLVALAREHLSLLRDGGTYRTIEVALREPKPEPQPPPQPEPRHFLGTLHVGLTPVQVYSNVHQDDLFVHPSEALMWALPFAEHEVSEARMHAGPGRRRRSIVYDDAEGIHLTLSYNIPTE